MGQGIRKGQIAFKKIKNSISNVVNTAISKVKALFSKAKKSFKSGKYPSVASAGNYIKKQVKKLSSLSPSDLKKTLSSLKENYDKGLIRTLAKEKLLKLLDPIKQQWIKMTTKAPPAKKPESKLWQIVFEKSKAEVHESVAKDFKGYMVAAHFDINEAKRALNAGK